MILIKVDKIYLQWNSMFLEFMEKILLPYMLSSENYHCPIKNNKSTILEALFFPKGEVKEHSYSHSNEKLFPK